MRRGYPGGAIGRGGEKLEGANGGAPVRSDELGLLEAVEQDYRLLNRELDNIGWTMLNIAGQQPSEMTYQARRKTVQRARNVWLNDPQAGASVELMNDFTFGRGVPGPRCKDKKVQ